MVKIELGICGIERVRKHQWDPGCGFASWAAWDQHNLLFEHKKEWPANRGALAGRYLLALYLLTLKSKACKINRDSWRLVKPVPHFSRKDGSIREFSGIGRFRTS